MQTEDTNKNSKFEIIGKDHQILQLILYPNDSINLRPGSIVYQSTNIKCQFDLKMILRHQETSFETKMNTYRNDSQTLGYIGISSRIGKILVFNTEDHDDMLFKEQNLLAHDSQLKLTKNNGSDLIGFFTWNKMQSDKDKSNHLFFLQSTGLVIEKELGVEEEMLVNKNCLFAFSSKLKFIDKRVNLIRVKGPGTLYIENFKSPDSLLTQKTLRYLLIPIILIFIQSMFL